MIAQLITLANKVLGPGKAPLTREDWLTLKKIRSTCCSYNATTLVEAVMDFAYYQAAGRATYDDSVKLREQIQLVRSLHGL